MSLPPARTALRSALAGLLLALAAACSRVEDSASPGAASADAAAGSVLRYQGSVGMVGFPELAEDLGYLAPLRLEWVGNTISGPQDIQSVATGATDVGGAFNGAVAKLAAARAPIRAVLGYYGVDEHTWTGFYVLQDSPIRGPRDLIGASVSMNTLGAHHDFMLREYLFRNGLSPQEIEQVSRIVIPPVTAELSLRQGQIQVATLGGVVRDKALERGGLRRLFSDHDLYGRFTAGSLVFREDFIRAHPQAVRAFVAGTARAIEWAREQPREQVQARMRAIIAARKRNEDDSLVQYWQSTGVSGQGGLIADREFEVWIDWLVRDGQLAAGALRPADLYTNEFNPYAERPS